LQDADGEYRHLLFRACDTLIEFSGMCMCALGTTDMQGHTRTSGQ
jgi:hypothetical protein